jgi:hypothetical protein
MRGNAAEPVNSLQANQRPMVQLDIQIRVIHPFRSTISLGK